MKTGMMEAEAGGRGYQTFVVSVKFPLGLGRGQISYENIIG
jgi:hypothetical protein